jgi:hypothetical protein
MPSGGLPHYGTAGRAAMNNWIPVIVGLIAAITALIGYLVNGRLNRINDKTKFYAEALTAVEHYKQLPYTLYRLHDSTPETRAQLATMIGEIQESLSFHTKWLELGAPEVGAAYKELVHKVGAENSKYRQQALDAPPPDADADLDEFRNKFPTHSDAESEHCLAAMRRELKFSRLPHRLHPTDPTAALWRRGGYEA